MRGRGRLRNPEVLLEEVLVAEAVLQRGRHRAHGSPGSRCRRVGAASRPAPQQPRDWRSVSAAASPPARLRRPPPHARWPRVRLLPPLASCPFSPPAPLAFPAEEPRQRVAGLAAGSAGAAAVCIRGACVREKPLRREDSWLSCPTSPLAPRTPAGHWAQPDLAKGFRQQEAKRGGRGRDRAASRPSLRVLFDIPGLCKRCKINQVVLAGASR